MTQPLDPIYATVTIGPGEFFDRLSILEIKVGRLIGPKYIAAKRALITLQEDASELLGLYASNTEVCALVNALKDVNKQLWSIENKIRGLDAKVFPVDLDTDDDKVIENTCQYLSLARSVYVTNDERSRLKAELDRLFGIVAEAKGYTQYGKAEQAPTE